MRLRIGERTLRGRALDLHDEDLDATQLLQAIRNQTTADLDLACTSPTPVHEHVGYIHDSARLRLRSALATVARAEGADAPQDDEIATIEEQLASLSPPTIDLNPAKRRVAERSGQETQHRERVAAARGRIEALRETTAASTAVTAAETALSDAIERLAEVETERIAAEQRLTQLQRAATDARAVRQQRLELQDRIDNLRRAARIALASDVYERFAAAVAAVPGDADPGTRASEYQGDAITGLLAIVHMTDVRAPVILALAEPRFPSAEQASARLDVPVIGL